MDDIDKKILIQILREGKINQRRIALNLGLSPQLVNYKIRKLKKENIFKGLHLYVHPNYFNFVNGYVAIDGELSSNKVIARFGCIDGTNLYEVVEEDIPKLEKFIVEVSKKNNLLAYFIPDQRAIDIHSEITNKIIRLLSRDPNTSSLRISKLLQLPRKAVVRHIRSLVSRGIIKFIPLIDISKSNITLFMVISRKLNLLKTIVKPRIIWDFSRGDSGMIILLSDDLQDARDVIGRIKEVDEDAMIIIKYIYEYYSNNLLMEKLQHE